MAVSKRLQLRVEYLNGGVRTFPVNVVEGWRIDEVERVIVLGRFPRTYIPLEVTACFTIEEVPWEPPPSVSTVGIASVSTAGSEAGDSVKPAQSGASDEVQGANPS